MNLTHKGQLRSSRSFVLMPLLFGVVAILATAPTPAVADYCGACISATQRDGERTRAELGVKIQKMASDIATVITNTTRDSTAAITRQQTEAAKAESKTAIRRDQEADKREVERSIGEVSCDFASTANGPKGGNVTTGGGGGGSGKGSKYKPGAKVSKEGKDALKIAGQTGEKVELPRDMNEQKRNIAFGGCDTFAAPGSERALICEGLGAKVSGSLGNLYPDADISATSLFDGPARDGQGVRLLSVPRSGDTRDARSFFLMNATNPIPLPPFMKGALDTPAGSIYAGLFSQYKAIKDVGEFPLREYDRLTSSPDPADVETRQALQSAYEALIADPNSATGQFAQNYLSSIDALLPTGSPKTKYSDLSPLDLMNFEVERRVGNPDWVKSLAGMDEKQKQAEMMLMQAYSMRIEFAQLQATYQTNVLLGQLISNQAEEIYRPRLEGMAANLEGAYLDRQFQSGSGSAAAETK